MKPSIIVTTDSFAKIQAAILAKDDTISRYIDDCVLSLAKYYQAPTGENLDAHLEFMLGLQQLQDERNESDLNALENQSPEQLL
jgi:hypothetical protein